MSTRIEDAESCGAIFVSVARDIGAGIALKDPLRVESAKSRIDVAEETHCINRSEKESHYAKIDEIRAALEKSSPRVNDIAFRYSYSLAAQIVKITLEIV